MDQYDFQHLKATHASQYARLLSEWNQEDPELDARVARVWTRIEERNKRFQDCAKEMGMTFFELADLDSEVDPARRRYRELDRKDIPLKPGCMRMGDNERYAKGAIAPKKSKEFYKHYERCGGCRKEVFLLSIMNAQLEI